jgi:hypothetical protein
VTFAADHVRIAEALYRSEAHCVVACELYGAGRRADAVLQSVRPIADTFPWLETELRSRPEQLRNLMVAVSNLSGALRHSARPRVARRHLKTVTSSRKAAVDALVGMPADEASFRSAVGVGLLRSACRRYADGVPHGNLNDYQAAYALVHAAACLIGGSDEVENGRLEDVLQALQAALPTLDPPARLIRPEDLEALVVEMEGLVGARPATTEGDVARVEGLLDDVVRSYAQAPALAARLAASLYVRTYDPLRPALAALDPGAEARLGELLGVDLRRAINDQADQASITAVADAARGLLGTLRERALSSRDDAALDTSL